MKKQIASLSLGFLLMASARIQAQPVTGHVYTLTNQAAGNSVLVFNRGVGGALALTGSFPTGGTGTGTGNDPLGSQGAVVLDQSGRLLFAVNAGRNDVTALQPMATTWISLTASVPAARGR